MSAAVQMIPARVPPGIAERFERPWKLNLGCLDTRFDGFIGVDRFDAPEVDWIADLTKTWPWEDNSVAQVIAHDVFEHFPDPIHTMNELWRVLEPEGQASIIVPSSDSLAAFQDPTHKSFWNRNSFVYYVDQHPYRERMATAYGIRAKFVVIPGTFDEPVNEFGEKKVKLVVQKVP